MFFRNLEQLPPAILHYKREIALASDRQIKIANTDRSEIGTGPVGIAQ